MSTGDEFDGTKDEPGRWEFAPPQKPDVAPSDSPYVSPARNPEAGIVSAATPEFCKYEGFTPRGLLAQLWDVPESRIAFRGSFDEDARFDVQLVPRDPGSVEMDALLRDGIATHFGFDVTFEDQRMDVLVLSAPNGIVGIGPPGGGGMSSYYASFEVDEASMPALDQMRDELLRRMQASVGRTMFPASPFELSLGGTATVDSIRDMLEHLQERLVVDETGSDGSFEVDLSVDGGIDGLLAALREIGIETTASRRDVRMLVVRQR